MTICGVCEKEVSLDVVFIEHLKKGLVRHKKGPSEVVSFHASIQLRMLIKVRGLQQKFTASRQGE